LLGLVIAIQAHLDHLPIALVYTDSESARDGIVIVENPVLEPDLPVLPDHASGDAVAVTRPVQALSVAHLVVVAACFPDVMTGVRGRPILVGGRSKEVQREATR
jgi:hypothetical protein